MNKLELTCVVAAILNASRGNEGGFSEDSLPLCVEDALDLICECERQLKEGQR